MPKIITIPLCSEEKELEITNFKQSSKDVQPNCLFFALKGATVDGHDFLEAAAQNGAIAAVVDKNYQGNHFGMFLFRSENVLLSLQELAKNVLQERKPQVIAITGSVGKTTTKEFTATFLEGKYRIFKSPESFNTKITLPLNILNTRGDEEYLVLEMGMSSKGEIETLTTIAPPDIALITKIALAHAMNFEDGLLGIAQAKGEVFLQEKTKIALANYQLHEFALEKKPNLTFSLDHPEADFFLFVSNQIAYIDEKGLRVAEIPAPFVEKHLLEDFLAAAAIARSCKMSWDEISQRIPFLKLPSMRFEKICKKETLFINDAYNANPESMMMALKNLPFPAAGGKKIAVLGEMKELGSFSQACHEEVGKCALETVDYLLALGKDCEVMFKTFKEAQKPAEIFFEKETLAQRLNELIRPGDVVLIKGSRSVGLEEVFHWII
ncbi:MAG: UDP-N-acetylmuramoyl-tripeptide--D-alanyl-D-alanine ligase [Chlamydiota bacterium]